MDPDEPLPGLLVVGKCLIGVPRRAQHRREVHQDGAKEDVGSAGFPAQVVRPASQLLGASEIPDRTLVVDQVGGGPERVHVVHA
jgi:hypothetical protein